MMTSSDLTSFMTDYRRASFRRSLQAVIWVSITVWSATTRTSNVSAASYSMPVRRAVPSCVFTRSSSSLGPVTLNTGTGELPVSAAICSTSDPIALSRTASARNGNNIRATELAILVSISRQAVSKPLTTATACWSDHLARSSPSRIALRTRSSAILDSPSATPAAWPRRKASSRRLTAGASAFGAGGGGWSRGWGLGCGWGGRGGVGVWGGGGWGWGWGGAPRGLSPAPGTPSWFGGGGGGGAVSPPPSL